MSKASADRPDDEARALVVGRVSFEMTFRCDVDGDSLLVTADGSIALRLARNVEVDIRAVVVNPGAKGSSPEATLRSAGNAV